MPVASQSRKSVLKRGDIAAIARRLKLSINHVSLCEKGERTPGPKLDRELQRVRARREAELASSTAA